MDGSCVTVDERSRHLNKHILIGVERGGREHLQLQWFHGHHSVYRLSFLQCLLYLLLPFLEFLHSLFLTLGKWCFRQKLKGIYLFS